MEKPQRGSAHYNEIELDILRKALDGHKGKVITLARELSPKMHRTVPALENKLNLLRHARSKAEFIEAPPVPKIQYVEPVEPPAPVVPKERNYCIIEFGEFSREGSLTNINLFPDGTIVIKFSKP